MLGDHIVTLPANWSQRLMRDQNNTTVGVAQADDPVARILPHDVAFALREAMSPTQWTLDMKGSPALCESPPQPCRLKCPGT